MLKVHRYWKRSLVFIRCFRFSCGRSNLWPPGGINNVFLEQASWSGRCILGCLFRPAEVNRSNRNWHADAPRSPETVANSDLRKTQPLGNDNGSRPWPLSSFSQDQRVGRSFCSRSFHKKWRETRSSIFRFSPFRYLFSSRDSSIPIREITFIRRKFFAKEHRNERNIIYSRIKITRIWYSSFQRNLKKEQSVNVTLLNPRMPRSAICFSRSNEYVHQHKLMFSQATARNIILSNDIVKAKTTVTR